jgi:glycosyltransferase involved in cell wall biosynthesis
MKYDTRLALESFRHKPHQANRKEGGTRLCTSRDIRLRSNGPLVSIITVVYNGEQHLEKTFASVLNQKYDNLEYIVIDGASTDGTLDIIRKYEKHLAYWLSEPDQGIYDAMNKGIELATGEWINFMNAGDSFYSPDVIASIFADREEKADVVYGDHHVVYNSNYTKIEKAGEIKDLWKGMTLCHQSLFIRTSLLKSHKFDVRYKIAADFEVLYSFALSNYVFRNTGLVIASVAANGLSGINTFMNVKEQWLVVRRLSNSTFKNAFHIYRMINRLAKNIIKIILPEAVVNRIRVKLK